MAEKTVHHPIVYAFIDSQNLNLGTRNDLFKGERKVYSGWNLDFSRFRRYLKDKFRVQKAYLFIGYIAENEPMYSRLRSAGYEIIFKPTTKDRLGKPKGNIDAELVLYAASIEYANYDQAVIVSGDGDFYCLHRYLLEKQKLLRILIPNSKSLSTLLRPLHTTMTFLQHEKKKLEQKK
jgi:uncharacterized LabA/DUF88 family protein